MECFVCEKKFGPSEPRVLAPQEPGDKPMYLCHEDYRLLTGKDPVTLVTLW